MGSSNMSIKKRLRQIVKNVVLGGDALPQRFFLGQSTPQTEITVLLQGMGEPQDVTYRHTLACPAPFTVCIAFEEKSLPQENDRNKLTLQFCETGGRRRILGEIGLRWTQTISKPNASFLFFHARSAANYCLPPIRLWTNKLLHTYAQRRSGSDIKMSDVERDALAVMFICPRPVSLVSVANGAEGNIFPINVMGDLNNGYFAFGLKDGKLPAQFVEQVRQIALSSVPMREAAFAYSLGANHNKRFIDWYKLPFETKPSETLHVPVPVFAYRVREMHIESHHNMGSHILFIARVVSESEFSQGPELCVVHGFYQAWRIRELGVNRLQSCAEDARVRAEMAVATSIQSPA